MEDKKEKELEDLLSEAKAYVETRIQYTKLSYIEKASRLFAYFITGASVVFCFVLAFLFGSVTLGLYLSAVFGSYVKGFGYIAIIYFLLSTIIFLIKNRYLERLLINLFIRKYFDKVNDEDEEK